MTFHEISAEVAAEASPPSEPLDGEPATTDILYTQPSAREIQADLAASEAEMVDVEDATAPVVESGEVPATPMAVVTVERTVSLLSDEQQPPADEPTESAEGAGEPEVSQADSALQAESTDDATGLSTDAAGSGGQSPPDTRRPTSGEADDSSGSERQEAQEVARHEAFVQQARDIRAALDSGTAPQDIPGFVSEDWTSLTFEAEENGTTRIKVVHLHEEEAHPPDILRKNHLRPLETVKAQTGFEQLVDFVEQDDEVAAVVVEKPQGRLFRKLSREEAEVISPYQFAEFLKGCDQAIELGVKVCNIENGVYYDPEAGFTLTELRMADPTDRYGALSAGKQALLFGSILLERTWQEGGGMPEVVQDFLHVTRGVLGGDDADFVQRRLESEAEYFAQMAEITTEADRDFLELGDSTEISASAEYMEYLSHQEAVDGMLANGTPPDAITGFVAADPQCLTFKTFAGYHMKMPLPRTNPDPDFFSREYVKPLEAGMGIEGIEQLIEDIDPTATTEGAVIVVPIEGRLLEQMTQEERDRVPPEHYVKLIQTFTRMAERRLVPDCSNQKIFYSETDGFTLAGYQLDVAEVTPYSPEDIANKFVQPEAVLLADWTSGNQAFPQAARNYIAEFARVFGDVAKTRLLENLRATLRAQQRINQTTEAVTLPDDL